MSALRRFILTIGFINILPFLCFSQIDTAEIYHNSRHVAFFQTRNVEKLSTALAKSCSNDEEVVLSYAYWICKNLKYDYAEYEKRPAESKSIKKILRSKKALSDGYTKLFVEMCNTQRIPAIYVPGYTKDYDFVSGDTLYRAEYAWALVKLGDEWNIMDLTAASSKVTAYVSPVSKFLWTLFKIPYSSHLVSVRDYDPSYLYVNPVEHAKRHLAAVDMFQLLRYPIPITSYLYGDSVLNSYLANYPDIQKNSMAVDEFSEKTLLERNQYFADKSLDTNPFTQFTKALYYYYYVKMFFNANYIEEKGKVFAPLEESKKAYLMSQVADSLFAIASQNNMAEQNSKFARSESWKKSLIESNKALSVKLSTQTKVNTQQIRDIEKVNSSIKKIESYIMKYKGKYVLRDIIDLPKPMAQNKDLLDEAKAKIQQVEDISEEIAELTKNYNSLMLKKSDMDSVFKQQTNASNMCNEELASLSRYIDRKGSNLSLVYYSDKYVFKKDYFDAFSMVDTINEKYTDPMIGLISERVPQINDWIQKYVNKYIEAFTLLKEAKVMLTNDYGEDDMYEKLALELTNSLGKIESQLEDVVNFNMSVIDCLNADVVGYKDIVKMLQDDNSLESYRHKEYMDYRKSLRQAENDKIKYYQETLKNYQKLISKAVNTK